MTEESWAMFLGYADGIDRERVRALTVRGWNLQKVDSACYGRGSKGRGVRRAEEIKRGGRQQLDCLLLQARSRCKRLHKTCGPYVY